jgi:hypothetical protein
MNDELAVGNGCSDAEPRAFTSLHSEDGSRGQSGGTWCNEGLEKVMTLVVAHRIPRGVHIASDMRISDPGTANLVPGYTSAVLKAVIVDPQICLAYAGRVAPAISAIRRVAIAAPIVDADEIAQMLLAAHQRANGQTEFLLTTLNPVRLTRIADNSVERDLPSAWLGDFEAFQLFQESYVGGKVILEPNQADEMGDEERAGFAERIAAARAESLKRWEKVLPADEYEEFVVASKQTEAMRAVINSGLTTVGESSIFAVPRPPLDANAKFAYTELSRASTGRQRPTRPGLNPLQAGSAAHGDFSYAILTPSRAGIGAVGIYFLEGRLGLLYAPLKRDGPRKYTDVSVAQFKKAVKEEYGIPLEGIGIGAS